MKSTLVLSLECKQYFIYRKCVLLEPPRILRVVSSLTFGPPARGFLGIFAVVGMSLFWRCHFFHNFYRSPFSSWIFCSFSISILLEVTMSYIFHSCFLLLIDHYYTDVLHWCSITITCLSALDLKVPQDLSMRFCHSIMLFPFETRRSMHSHIFVYTIASIQFLTASCTLLLGAGLSQGHICTELPGNYAHLFCDCTHWPFYQLYLSCSCTLYVWCSIAKYGTETTLLSIMPPPCPSVYRYHHRTTADQILIGWWNGWWTAS